MLRAFAVFDCKALPLRDMAVQGLERLARAFKVGDVESTIHQYFAARSSVSQASTGLPSMEIWRQALLTHPGHELGTILTHCACLSGSTTSGVEHGHSLQDWLFTRRRACLQVSTECDEMKLVHDFTDKEMSIVLELAQEIWCVFYGAPRWAHGRRKYGARKTSTCSLRAMVGRTIKSVQSAASRSNRRSFSHICQDATNHCADIWDDAMQAEVDFNTVCMPFPRARS